MHPMLRRFFIPLLLLLIPLTGANAGQVTVPAKVPLTDNLQADARLARERNLPLLIMFSMRGCGYCDMVREDFLEPMLKSGDYADKVIMRIIRVDDYGEVRDFDGEYRQTSNIATRYRASVTPTVIFVDHKGHELAPRLLGISTPGFYGGYLDEGIDRSLRLLRPITVSQQGPGGNG